VLEAVTDRWQVVFELWKKGGQFFVRVMWSGQPLKTSTPLGTLDMVSLTDFNAYLDATLAADPVALCRSS
jgi:acid phosphatase